MSYKTRAGLEPSTKKLPFEITTDDVQKYLQEKFDIVAKNANIPKVEISVYTVESSRLYAPFMLILPMTALVNKKNERHDDIDNILKLDETTARIYKPYNDTILEAFKYDKSQKGEFNDPTRRREMDLSRRAVNDINYFSIPRISKFGNVKVVTVLLNPVRVFYDMLKGVDNDLPSTFYVCPVEMKKLSNNGNYKYVVERVADNGGNRKRKDSMFNQLNARMRGYGKR